ncbi:hypothetical protein chiPu_0003944 [Chiloscyllium punctatum]|uniref:Uncharacterized protein n=1 Tax=Chiloscyllium punctatum TaxID=137246 RepID=A0A401S555_CHIPU|nr:hypothetical protein [Chiloscyllium punctatum]
MKVRAGVGGRVEDRADEGKTRRERVLSEVRAENGVVQGADDSSVEEWGVKEASFGVIESAQSFSTFPAAVD